MATRSTPGRAQQRRSHPTIRLFNGRRISGPKGVFSLYRPSVVDPQEPVDRRPLDVIVAERPSAQALLHFTLPIDQSPALLRLLAKEGVSGTSLFPGYVGVVAGLQEEQFWRTRTASAPPKWGEPSRSG